MTMTVNDYSNYVCPGCNKPLPITGVRQRRTLDNGGKVFHNRECQKAASRETRPCKVCSTPVTRRRSAFTSNDVFCPEHRGGHKLNRQTYACEQCGSPTQRTPANIVGAIYCSKACFNAAQSSHRIPMQCVRDGCDNTVHVPQNRAVKASGRGSGGVFCSKDCRKLAARIELPCTGGCGTKVWRYRSQLAKRVDNRQVRVFCEECRKDNGMKPRRGSRKPCATCGTPVYRRPSEDDGGPRYCGNACYGKSLEIEQRERPTRVCVVCGKPFPLNPDRIRQGVKTCSRVCTTANRRRKPGERYVDPQGYVWVTTPDGRSVLEHRYVMELEIGRPILPTETVHHKKGGRKGRSNNSLDNLELWSGRHPKGHRVEDIVHYCREMLAVYGAADERERYSEYRPAVETDPGDKLQDPARL